MRMDYKDKDFLGNVLVAIEWFVTFFFLVLDKGDKILHQVIPVIVICGYLTILLFPFFIIQKITMFRDVSMIKMLDFYFWGYFISSIGFLCFFLVSYFIFQTNLCLYLFSQGGFFWLSVFRKKYIKNNAEIV